MPEIILAPGTNRERTLTDSDIAGRLQPERVHTGEGTCRIDVVPDPTLDDYAARQDRLTVKTDGGTVVFTGYLIDSTRSRRDLGHQLRAVGIAKRLEETRPDYAAEGGAVTYSDIALQDALRNYWSRTPFGNVTVKDQPTQTVATNEPLQSADATSEFNAITSLSASDPVVVDNGELRLAQVAYVFEAETASGGGVVSDSAASAGAAETVFETFHDLSFTANVEYTIPAENVGVAFRKRNPKDPDSDGVFEGATGEVLVDGSSFGTAFGAANFDDYGWSQETSYPGSDVSGSTSVTVDVTNAAPSGASTFFDLVVLYDTRFALTFDNSVDSNGYLSGPELFPSGESVVFDEETTQFNLDAVDISLTVDDTSGAQAIEASFDSGSSYSGAANTDSVTVQNTGGARSVQTRLTLDRYGSRTSATPTSGFKTQRVDVYDLTADLNNLVVVDELDLSRNHFSNLKTLHEYGDFVFAIEHTADDVADMPVTSFRRGTESRPSPAEFKDPIDRSAGIQSSAYYNTIFLQGAEDSQGDRPTAEVRADQSVIDEDGREISPGVLRDETITTEAGAAFRAQAILDAAQTEADLVGSKTITPVPLLPGFSYSVDLGNGAAEKVLERVRLSYGDQIESTAEFARETQLSREISDLKRNVSDIGDQV